MQCQEFEKLIPEFINNTLSEKDYDEFIKHSKECKRCLDELEIHYMIKVGLERANGDSQGSFDLKNDLHKRLMYYECKADALFKHKVYKKLTYFVSQVCTIIIVVIFILFLLKLI